jgi:hypothetical protein
LKEDRRPYAKRLFENYTKRNASNAYVQSHGMVGSRIIDAVLDYQGEHLSQKH